VGGQSGNTIRMLGTTGIVGVLVFAATGLLMHVVQPDLNPLERLGSDYVHGRLGWVFVLGFVAIGVGVWALAAGVWRLAVDGGRRSMAAACALGTSGVAFIVTGIVETDPLGPDGLPMRTLAGHVHNVASFVAFAGVIAAAAVLSTQFARTPGWERQGRVTRVFTWTMAMAFVATAIAGPGALLAGLVQRLFVAILLTWLVLLGIWLRRGSSVPGHAGKRKITGG
jgi:hypothetical protein